MPNPYRGARTPDKRGKWNQPRQAGVISDERQAWLTLPNFDFILFVGQGDEEYFEPDTPPVRVEFRQPGRRWNTRLSLTQLTAPELEELKKFFDHAFEKARPICEKLDERAQEAFASGNDGHSRLYRPLPIFYDRERFLSEYREGVPKRSERLVDGVQGEASSDLPGPPIGSFRDDASGLFPSGTGGDGGELADDEPERVVTEYDEPEAGSTS